MNVKISSSLSTFISYQYGYYFGTWKNFSENKFPEGYGVLLTQDKFSFGYVNLGEWVDKTRKIVVWKDT